ncbi:hypothetical protein SAMN05421595_0750 [Austwickia chelonae]|uniref:Heavy metal transporter n=1 Tax=Austwickia chelonae NBRC 105200 TaxID=1184607 RepID=K6VND2_9MICO|nr:hypothetical protein [Austwickia chelonae]GAB78234.1 hypothetical protein AUCHE_08_04800 [Austwickia chelonae NBRC 105200]SEV99281.1 hypothetical protein SAMN05421595_0750 [Austwickia chelonae]
MRTTDSWGSPGWGVAEPQRPPNRTRRNRFIAGLGALVLGATGVVFVHHLLDTGFIGPPRCTFTNQRGAEFDLSTEQVRHASTISAAASRRQLPPRAATIAIATAMQESKLRNLAGGDRDSVGLFQQRPSQGWGTVAQIRDPVYSTDKFYDGLVKVPGWQEMPLTKAAQKVQLSGFPNAYAQHETPAEAYAAPLTGIRPLSMNCSLGKAEAGSSAAEVQKLLLRETGLRAQVKNNTLVIEPRTARAAGTAATWALAGAHEFGVSEIRLGKKVWKRDASSDAPAWADHGEPAADNAVRITMIRQ